MCVCLTKGVTEWAPHHANCRVSGWSGNSATGAAAVTLFAQKYGTHIAIGSNQTVLMQCCSGLFMHGTAAQGCLFMLVSVGSTFEHSRVRSSDYPCVKPHFQFSCGFFVYVRSNCLACRLLDVLSPLCAWLYSIVPSEPSIVPSIASLAVGTGVKRPFPHAGISFISA